MIQSGHKLLEMVEEEHEFYLVQLKTPHAAPQRLQNYDMTLRYQVGKTLFLADGLSVTAV